MEPIYVHSNQYQPPGSHSDNTSSNTSEEYTLTLSQTVLPNRADEITSVVARSPIDRFEHSFSFDSENEYLAWTIATDAQRKATHLGYDPAQAGIEAIVIGPDEQYGRLDDFFTSQPPMTPSRLVVYKQNVKAGATEIKDHLGPKHEDRFVGTFSHELAAQSAGRALLSDLVKAYAKEKVVATLDETRHPYSRSLGFQSRGEAKHTKADNTDLESVIATPIAKAGLRYTRIDLEGQPKHYAIMKRKDADDQIGIQVLTPRLETSYLVHGGVESRADQYEAACWVFDHIAERDADGKVIDEYYDALIRLAD